mmetsp:Transcript_87946/g.244038  ORF Transcript_87946/g.244038 Transcript_87946/m.244038 type:complete len:375 (-) Transcript_87946:107-1231(-)
MSQPGGRTERRQKSAPMPCALKFLAPEALAAAVIGKKGAAIAAMRQSTQAKIALTEHNDLYPGTECRVLTAQANTEQALTEVTTSIIAKLAESVESSPSEQLGSPGELKLRTLMPRAAVGGLIGKGGAVIKQLRDSSGAKISVGEAAGAQPGGDQAVSMVGSQEALESVMAEVNRNVQALSGEAWFQTWAATTATTAGTSAMMNGQTYSGFTGAQVSLGGAGYGGAQGGGGMLGFGAPGGGAGGVAMGSPGADLMLRVAQGLPPYVTQDERGFALSCVVPNRLVGGLIGRGGAGTKEVQALTGTKISIREIVGDTENRSMNIAGPLASTCAAYMLMMKRYLDAEAQAASAAAQSEGRPGGGGRRREPAAPQPAP